MLDHLQVLEVENPQTYILISISYAVFVDKHTINELTKHKILGIIVDILTPKTVGISVLIGKLLRIIYSIKL